MTSVWFTRSNGTTAHSNPADDNFVPGEHAPRYLAQFATIQVGDIVLIPAVACGQYRVHLGMAVRRGGERRELIHLSPGGSAYYFVSALPFECAHRVDVSWAADKHGVFHVAQLPELGGLWRRAFGPVRRGRDRALFLARDFGFAVGP